MKNTFIICIKRGALLLVVFGTLLSMTGCGDSPDSNFHSIENLQLIQTLGIDSAERGVLLTVSSGQSLEGQPSVTISREDRSISSALENVRDFASKEELFYEHARFALVGEDAASEELSDFFDYLVRSARMRLDMTLFVVKEGQARELLTRAGEKGFNATEDLASLEKDVRHRGISHPFTIREIIRSLAQYGSALACSVTALPTENIVYAKDVGELTAYPSGFAVIKGTRLLAYLDSDRARAANLLMNRVGHGAMTLDTETLGRVTVSTRDGNAEYSAQWGEDGSLKELAVSVDLSFGLLELSHKDFPTESSENLEIIRLALENKLTDDCASVLMASKDLESDFLGLKGALRLKYPNKLAAMKEDFASALKNTDIRLKVTCQVKTFSDLEQAEPLTEGGGRS